MVHLGTLAPCKRMVLMRLAWGWWQNDQGEKIPCNHQTEELEFISHDEEKVCSTAHTGLNEQWSICILLPQWKKGTNLLSHPLLLVTVALVVGLADAFTLFLLLPGASAEEYVVDKSILQECQEHEDKAAHEININSLDVRDLRKSLPQMGVDSSHCKHRGDPCKERVGALLPRWDGFLKHHSQLPHTSSSQLDNLRRGGNSATGNKIFIILKPAAQYKSLQKINQLPTAGENVKAKYHQDDGDQHPLDLASLHPP